MRQSKHARDHSDHGAQLDRLGWGGRGRFALPGGLDGGVNYYYGIEHLGHELRSSAWMELGLLGLAWKFRANGWMSGMLEGLGL